jgi:hypothetical protein
MYLYASNTLVSQKIFVNMEETINFVNVKLRILFIKV